MPKKTKGPKGMKPRQCAKALKSKAVQKVMAALEDPICSDPKFLSGKLGVIPLLNILGKKKMADVKVKVLEIAAKFVTADTQNAFAIIQGGLKGTAKWCGAQAVLPYLLDTEANNDAGLTPSQQNAWAVFAAVTQITAALQPEEAKRADLQAQYLSGGKPLALLLEFIGADTEDYSPSGPCARSLACLAFLVVSENPEFVSTVVADIVAMDGATALVKAARAGGVEIRQQALAILLQLKATDGGDKHLVVSGACDVFAEALDFGCKQVLDKKRSTPVSELTWISDTVTTLADLMSDGELDRTFPITSRVPETPPEDPAGSVEVVDSITPSVDAVIELLEVQHAQDSQPLVDVLCKSLSKLCRREVYYKQITALVPRQPPPAQEEETDQEAEEAAVEAKEGKEGDADNPDAPSTANDDEGAIAAAEEEIAPIEVSISYERTQAIKERIFQLGATKLMQCLNKCEAGTREQVEFVLHSVLAGPKGDILTAPREVCVMVHKMMVLKPLSTKDKEADQARYTREVHIALMAARLVARLVDSEENYEVLRSIGILETVLSIVGKAGDTELQAELELAVRSNQILEHLVSTPEVCAKVGGSDSGSAAINGLFWFLFSGPKMVDVKDIKSEGVIAIDSRMLGAHTLALIVDGAGEEGTAKVLDGCDSLFEKISDDGNTDELQVAILKLFGKLVSRRSGKRHIVTLIDRVELVHLIADLLPVPSASEVKIQAAVGGLSAMLLPPITTDEPENHGKKKGKSKPKEKTPEKAPKPKSPKAKGNKKTGKGKKGKGTKGNKGKAESKTSKQSIPSKPKEAEKKSTKKAHNDEPTAEELAAQLDEELVCIALEHGVAMYLIALLADCPTLKHAEMPELRGKITALLDYLLDFSKNHPDVIPFLDIAVDFTRYGLAQCTSLQTSVIAGQPGLVQSLLNLGVRTDIVDGRGYTPLMAALLYGQDEIVTSLVAAGADVDALHPKGDPVFKFAFMSPSDRVLSAVFQTVVADSGQEQTTIAGTAKHVPLFIANGVDTKVAGQEGGFPLHWLIAGTQAIVQYQFFAGTVHTRGVSGFGPDSDIYSRALQLIEAKADVNACDVNGDTPLHHALRHNLPDIASLLIDNGAQVNVLNGQGQLPIHLACASACGGVEMVTKLLDLGNDKPLSKAAFSNARRGLSKKEKIVLEISQVLDATYSGVIEPIVVTKRGATRNDLILAKDSAGRTPGVLVCGDSAVAPLQHHRSGGEEEDTRVAMLRAMVSLKANPVAYTNAETGVTALHQACKWASARFPVVENVDDSDSDVTTTGGLQLLRELVKLGGNIDAADTHTPDLRFTPLHYACDRNPQLAVSMLEEFKNVFAVGGYRDGGNGSNPPVLSLAVGRRVHQFQRAELVGSLRAVLGVEMDVFGSSETLADTEESAAVARYMGTSPLHLAAEMGSLVMVEALLKQDANVRARRANIDGSPNDAGITPLELAACNGHVDVVRELYDAGASLLTSSGDEVAGHILFDAINKSNLRLVQFYFKYNEELNADTLKQLVDQDDRTLAEVVEEKLSKDAGPIDAAIHSIVIEALKTEAEKLQERQQISAATVIQAQVRGMQARVAAMDAAEGEAIEGEDGDSEHVKQADEARKENSTVDTVAS